MASFPKSTQPTTTANDPPHDFWLHLLSALTQDPDLEELRHLRFEGIDVWPIVKATSVMVALNQRQGMYAGQQAGLARTAYRRLMGGLERLKGQFVPLKPLDAEFFCLANIAPALDIDGILINPHLDPLRTSLANRGKKTLTGYYDGKGASGTRFALHSRLLAGSFPQIGRALRNDVQRRLSKKLKSSNQILDNHFKRTNDTIINRIAMTVHLRKIYGDLFGRSKNLSGLFLTNYYNPHGWGAVAAAKELGVATIDVQHGVQGKHHHAYSWPELAGGLPNVVPDFFVCWTAADKDNLDSGSSTHNRSVVAGPSHFQLEALAAAEPKSDNAELTAALANLRAKSRRAEALCRTARDRNQRIVGLFLQYREDGNWLRALRGCVPQGTELWVRRHPGVRRRGAANGEHEIPGITIVDEYPLAALLHCLDLAVTGYSSVGIEAAHVGCPVLAYSPLARQFLEPYCRDAGFELTSEDPASLGSAICNQIQKVGSRRGGAALPNLESVVDMLLSRIYGNGDNI